MLKKGFLLTGILCILVLEGFSQVFIQNTLYPYNRFVYNPAAAGTADGTQLALMGRLQWLGIDGGPRLVTASINTPLETLQSGVGVHFVLDELGPLSTTGANASYAYHFQLRPGDVSSPRISIGAAAGVLQKRIDGTRFLYDQSGGIDPVVPTSNNSVIVPNLSAGIYLTLPDDKLFVGLSGQDLLEPSLEELLGTSSIGDDSKVSRSFYLMGGYRFDLPGRDITIQPTFMGRAEGGLSSFQFDLSTYVHIRSLITFGVSHRFYNDSFSGMAGFRITENTFLGYAFDYTVSDLNANGDLSSHEIFLSYTFRTAKRTKGPLDNVIKKPR